MIDSKQLRKLIRTVLIDMVARSPMNLYKSEDPVELLMLTSAQETHCGRYIEQVKGPALGIFQMEPASFESLVRSFRFRMLLDNYDIPEIPDLEELSGNIILQIASARLYYFRVPYPLPSKDNVLEMATYYKKWWNTYLGKATIESAIDSYNKYAFN
jgi:hypothetical protein